MNWVAIIQVLIKAVAGVVDYLGTRQLLDAGQSQAISEGLKATLDNLEKANAAQEEIRNNPDGDYARSVREKYTRTDE